MQRVKGKAGKTLKKLVDMNKKNLSVLEFVAKKLNLASNSRTVECFAYLQKILHRPVLQWYESKCENAPCNKLFNLL